MAYSIWWAQREAQTLADRQGLIARGAVEGLPNLYEDQQRFDEWLASEPVVSAASKLDPAEMELRRALKVA